MNSKILLACMATMFCFNINMHAQTTSPVEPVPQNFVRPVINQGHLETLTYDVVIDGKAMKKEAKVYLPFGYDAKDTNHRYNVLYLAHGGGDNPGSFFAKDRAPITLDEMANHLINDGQMMPMIIVSASYYTGINRGMNPMIDECREFNKEVRQYLIPAVAKQYNTYLRSTGDAAITATRAHRAYGGFSMGALSTWYQLAYDAAAFKYYLPLSGDLWIYDDKGEKRSAEEAAMWLNSQIEKTPYRESDIEVLAYTGSEDIAYVAQKNLIEMLDQKAPLFHYSTDPEKGNLHFSVLPKGVHSYPFVNQYLMNAMPRLWGQTTRGEYWRGADVSGITMMESRGVKFYNQQGEERDNLVLMRELGMNAVRLRVWVNPSDGFCNKEDVLKLALRAKEQGLAIMLCFHYSDSWADPGQQNIPKAWKKYNYKQMKRALAQHTTETLQLLKKNDIDVKWMQVGNETTHGMLWDMGRAEKQMEQYAGLTEAGYEAAKKVYPEVTCIVHLDCGADINRYRRVFDGLNQYGAHYDMIGMSVYPYWDLSAGQTKKEQETIDKVAENIQTLKAEYGKDVMLVETGYEAARPQEGYAFMRRLIDRTKTMEECHGVFYWAPELEQFYPLGAFDNHRPTKILDAFTEAATGADAQDTTFFSTVEVRTHSENGEIVGNLFVPHSSAYSHEGKLPVVIMAHGFGGNHWETMQFAQCLAKNGIAAYTFDFCGGGMQSQSTGKTTDMNIFTEKADLFAITSRLRSLPQIDGQQMMLLGCSQGALVSSITAADHANDYSALILIYPALGIPETAEAMLEKTKDTPNEFEFWGMKLSQQYYLPLVGFDAFSVIGQFEKPVLMVYGDKDPITAGNHIEKAKSVYKDVTLQAIKNGKHGFPNPFNHRLAENEVLKFVRKVLEK